MRFLLLFLTVIASFSVSAQQVEVARYTNVLVANEVLVKSNDVPLTKGDNQFVVEFDGRLKKKNKLESVSIRPQIIVVSDIEPTTDTLEIKLAAKTHKQLESLQSQNFPLFELYKNGVLVETSQQELPAASGMFPYQDPVALVKQHNNEQGLIFDSGNIRSLKQELEAAQNQPNSLANVDETEATLQLKIWYKRATREERVAFKKWLAEQ